MPGKVSVAEGPAGPVVRPRDAAAGDGATILYVPGDRYLSGRPEAALDLAGRLASQAGAAVVCCRYRPVFPEALKDVEAAYEHCGASGPVVVAGERLGGGLAAALLLTLRDRGAAMPRCAVLVSALLDLVLDAPSVALNSGADPAFDLAAFRRRVARYAAGAPLTDPSLSPLHGNLHGLPPVRLLAAGTDPLLDDSLAFAARAARSGVTVDLRVVQDPASLRAETVPAIAGFPARAQGVG